MIKIKFVISYKISFQIQLLQTRVLIAFYRLIKIFHAGEAYKKHMPALSKNIDTFNFRSLCFQKLKCMLHKEQRGN